MSKIVYNTDCNNTPDLPTILPPANRIIAIGDVHGDLQLVIDSLLISKVIVPTKSKINSVQAKIRNKMVNYEWIGGDTIVVQIGDQNDSCRPSNKSSSNGRGCDYLKNDTADDIKIFNFYNNLNELAQRKRGAVYSLLGNHELMNVQGDFKYASDANINMFKKYNDPITKRKLNGPAEENRKEAFYNGKEYANLLGCTRQSVLIIGEFLFVHAGITEYLLLKENFPDRSDLPRLNELMKNWLLQKLNNVDANSQAMDELLNSSDSSPFWTRIFGQLPPKLKYNDELCRQYLDPILEAYSIKGMIIGHTPQEIGINSTCGNRLFRIDIGASKAFDSKRAPQVLEIERLSDDNYKYTVIFQKDEVYSAIVDNDIKSFENLDKRLPN
jgi:hypothetical protein